MRYNNLLLPAVFTLQCASLLPFVPMRSGVAGLSAAVDVVRTVLDVVDMRAQANERRLQQEDQRAAAQDGTLLYYLGRVPMDDVEMQPLSFSSHEDEDEEEDDQDDDARQ